MLGILFLSRSQELLGLIFLLVGLMVGVRGSSGPVIVFVGATIQFSLVLLFLFLLEPYRRGWTFDEWASEHWLKMVAYGGLLACVALHQAGVKLEGSLCRLFRGSRLGSEV